ncbi:MAG: alpha/beta fold hydrolase [Bacteroidota bacterium]
MNPLRGELVTYAKIDSLSEMDIRALYQSYNLPELIAPINYGLDVYELVYRTPAANGDSLTVASGLALVPQDTCDFPILNYNHGSYFYGDEITNFGFEWFVGVPLGTGGYIVAMPDYLGFGATPISLPHPYIHAKSEASSTIDMIRATRNLCDSIRQRANDQLFLLGYSQGGHVAMATHKEMEQSFPNEFQPTAVAPCSGPYDVANISAGAFLADEPTSSFLLGFVMTSYQFVYGNLWNQPLEAFRPPYDVVIPNYFDRSNPQTNVVLPDTANRMLQPSYIQAITTDSTHPVRIALRDNDVYDWAPQAPTRMYYCEADELVPFQNALVALNRFQQNGAANVSAVSVNPTLDHTGCFFPAILFAKQWFETFQGICIAPIPQDTMLIDPIIIDTTTLDTVVIDTSSSGTDTTSNDTMNTQIDVRFVNQEILIMPNPVNDFLNFQFASVSAWVEEVEISDIQGRKWMNQRVARPLRTHQMDVSHLPRGNYVLAVRMKGGTLYKMWQKG